MIDVIKRGTNVAGLLYYLYGPGKANEHTDPHLVAGWRDVNGLEPPIRQNGKRDFRQLTGLLTAPLDALDPRADAKPVWHCILSAAPQDRLLSDAEWQEIAGDFMHRMGLARRDDDCGVRWVTVRHGLSAGRIDHIHIVATLARQDARRPWIRDDYLRAREACLAVERQYGLRCTAPADRTAACRPTRAENERAERSGRTEAPRITLRRHVQEAAAAAVSEEDFFAHLEHSGVLLRKRFSERSPSQVTGYAVGLPGDTACSDGPVWYGGGRLASDLTLPKLRHRWERSRNAEQSGTRPEHRLSAHSVRALLRSTACFAAEQARDEAEFFGGLEHSGILVRKRFSERNPGEITGYSVMLPGHTDAQGQPIWYGGGRLSADLTLPRLRHRWSTSHFDRPVTISPEERRAIWSDVASAADRAAEQIHRRTETDPSAAADAAWAAADTLRIAALVAHDTPAGALLGQAADGYDRAAREIGGRIPRHSSAGADLRTAARLLAMLGANGPSLRVAVFHLMISLAALAAEVARLRDIQQRYAQADAADAVAVDLHQAACRAKLPVPAQTRVARSGQETPAWAGDIAEGVFAVPEPRSVKPKSARSWPTLCSKPSHRASPASRPSH